MESFIAHGHRLTYRQRGSGPLLLILPGNTASSALHEGELAHFGARFHAVALDLLGTGGSERVAEWPSDWWEQGARDALALIEHLGQPNAVVIGTSGGAVAALFCAILAPRRVRALIADSCVEFSRPSTLRAEVADRAEKSPAQSAFWSDAHGPDWEDVVAADNRILLALAERGGDWFGGRLGEIRSPVLLTASLNDDLLDDPGPQALAMAARIPGAQVYLSNQGGHHPLMWSRPAEFRAAADAFLNTLDILSSKPAPLETAAGE